MILQKTQANLLFISLSGTCDYSVLSCCVGNLNIQFQGRGHAKSLLLLGLERVCGLRRELTLYVRDLDGLVVAERSFALPGLVHLVLQAAVNHPELQLDTDAAEFSAIPL